MESGTAATILLSLVGAILATGIAILQGLKEFQRLKVILWPLFVLLSVGAVIFATWQFGWQRTWFGSAILFVICLWATVDSLLYAAWIKFRGDLEKATTVACDAQTTITYTRRLLAESERARGNAEAIVRLFQGAAAGNDAEEREIRAIKRAVRDVEDLSREFGRIPESVIPPDREWKDGFEPQLATMTARSELPSENEGAYREALSDLKKLYDRCAPKPDYAQLLTSLRNLAGVDAGRLDIILNKRSARLTQILSSLPNEP